MAELVASLLQNDETTADIKVAFKLLKNTFQNISVTVSTMKYRISDAANDLKVMKESFFDLIQDLLYHSSKDVAKKVSGMCVVYSLLLFLNANVKKHHTFEFELDKCGDKKDILSSHNVWDSMWRLEKTISETLFCISPATFADLVARESEITALLYAEIVKNPGMRFEEWKPFGYDEHYSRFYCVLHFIAFSTDLTTQKASLTECMRGQKTKSMIANAAQTDLQPKLWVCQTKTSHVPLSRLLEVQTMFNQDCIFKKIDTRKE